MWLAATTRPGSRGFGQLPRALTWQSARLIARRRIGRPYTPSVTTLLQHPGRAAIGIVIATWFVAALLTPAGDLVLPSILMVGGVVAAAAIYVALRRARTRAT